MVRTRVTLLLGVWGASLQRVEVWKVKDTIWFVLNSVKQLLQLRTEMGGGEGGGVLQVKITMNFIMILTMGSAQKGSCRVLATRYECLNGHLNGAEIPIY